MQINRANPSVKSLEKYAVSDTGSFEASVSARASYAGVAVKIAIYLAITLVTGVAATALFFPLAEANAGIVIAALIAAPFVALVAGIVASLKPSASAIAGSIYCICYGVLCGALGAILEASGLGSLVVIALLCTVVVAGVMSLLYFSGAVRVGSKFRKFMLTALIAIIACQLIFLVMSIFTPIGAYYYDNFGLQLVICSGMVVFAALMILIDLDHITMVVENGLPKQLEWRAAFGLMVTLIWLFLRILRLLLVIASRIRR